jgi:RNA polymerase sigma factor (sigma-70 family)
MDSMTREQNSRIAEVVRAESARLRNFIRRQVDDRGDVEDILQEVFFEFVEAYRLMKPIEQAGAWLFRVARNRIVDRFRRRGREPQRTDAPIGEDGDRMSLEDLLPSPDAGPEAAYARKVLLAELDRAIDELPEEQREVFVAHEIEGRSFKELALESGLSINTLLGRKHLAVRRLRQRLEGIYNEFQKR